VGTRLPRLHIITSHRPLPTVRAAVRAATALGATDRLAVQVRVDDHVTDREAYELVLAVLAVCRPEGVLCLVNDRLDVAVATGADGAHVGADDLPVPAARRVLGPAAVLGATCRTPGAMLLPAPGPTHGAENRGPCGSVTPEATYFGTGPAYATTTKDGLPDPLGPDGVAAVVRAAGRTPVIAIGGIVADRVPALLAAGAHGVAVVAAVANAPDPERATGELLKALA
jgi:thiamine-phosphate pyrophosphorylase